MVQARFHILLIIVLNANFLLAQASVKMVFSADAEKMKLKEFIGTIDHTMYFLSGEEGKEEFTAVDTNFNFIYSNKIVRNVGDAWYRGSFILGKTFYSTYLKTGKKGWELFCHVIDIKSAKIIGEPIQIYKTLDLAMEGEVMYEEGPSGVYQLNVGKKKLSSDLRISNGLYKLKESENNKYLIFLTKLNAGDTANYIKVITFDSSLSVISSKQFFPSKIPSVGYFSPKKSALNIQQLEIDNKGDGFVGGNFIYDNYKQIEHFILFLPVNRESFTSTIRNQDAIGAIYGLSTDEHELIVVGTYQQGVHYYREECSGLFIQNFTKINQLKSEYKITFDTLCIRKYPDKPDGLERVLFDQCVDCFKNFTVQKAFINKKDGNIIVIANQFLNAVANGRPFILDDHVIITVISPKGKRVKNVKIPRGAVYAPGCGGDFKPQTFLLNDNLHIIFNDNKNNLTLNDDQMAYLCSAGAISDRCISHYSLDGEYNLAKEVLLQGSKEDFPGRFNTHFLVIHSVGDRLFFFSREGHLSDKRPSLRKMLVLKLDDLN